MTEREILKKLVRIVDSGLGLEGDIRTILNTEAREALRQYHDPDPEHPAVEAYRKWVVRELPIHTGPAEPFLAGWKRALLHIAENFDGQERRHLVAAGNATPTQLT